MPLRRIPRRGPDLHQLNDVAEDMRYWLRATTTVSDEQRAITYAKNTPCAQLDAAAEVLVPLEPALAALEQQAARALERAPAGAA